MSMPSPSRNGVSHPDARAARDPPTLTAQLAFAKCELAMARVNAQPNWWLADMTPSPSQEARRLACLEAICTTLAQCCEEERQRGEAHQSSLQGAQKTASAPDGPGQHRSGRGRTPPNVWKARPKPRGKPAPPDGALS
jgi:hypothetical protein